MKTMKMKALAVAVLGLVAGNAMAVCSRAGGDPSIAGGGAWSSRSASGGTAVISSDGLNGTACGLDSTLTVNNAFAQATVVDTTPTNEQQYRAQFSFNADNVTSISAFDAVQLLTLNSAAPFPQTNPTLQVLRLTLLGGGATGRQLGIIAACNNGGGNTCSATAQLPATGTNRIEVQVVTGNSGVGLVNYWVNSNVSGTPTGTLTLVGGTGGNFGWNGIKEARMGLAAPTLGFRQGHLNQSVRFDDFDSRRQTFVGF